MFYRSGGGPREAIGCGLDVGLDLGLDRHHRPVDRQLFEVVVDENWNLGGSPHPIVTGPSPSQLTPSRSRLVRAASISGGGSNQGGRPCLLEMMTSTSIDQRCATSAGRLRGGHLMAKDTGSWDADDEAAYAGLYLRSYPAVRRTVGVILRDWSVAEDVTQDAFVQLYVHWRKVSRYDSPEGWVRRVAIRLATRTAKRDRLREVLSLRAHVDAPVERPADLDLERAMEHLTPIQRAVVALYYFDDLPLIEVARQTGRSPSATKVALHRARRRLAEVIGVEADQDG